MPTLRRRIDMGGKFELDYTDPVDGKRYRVDTHTDDEKFAKVWLRKAEDLIFQAEAGMIKKVGRITGKIMRGESPSAADQKLLLDDFEERHRVRCKEDVELAASTLSIIKNAFDSFRGVAIG